MSATPLQPLRRASLADDVAEQLRRSIVGGHFAPGSPLAEPTLARDLGVSRAPIREALIALEREGLVQFDDRGRTRVRPLDPNDFEEVSTLRIALESLASERTCRFWDVDVAAELERNLALQHEARSLGELSSLDVEFHQTIVRAAKHDRLWAAWQPLRPQMEMLLTHTFRMDSLVGESSRERTVRGHRLLVDALASGEPHKASAEAIAHINGWRSLRPDELLM